MEREWTLASFRVLETKPALMLSLFSAKPNVGLGRTETSLGSTPVSLTASSSNVARPLSAMPVPAVLSALFAESRAGCFFC